MSTGPVNFPTEAFARTESLFIVEVADGVNATIQYSLSGKNGGEWFLSIASGTCTVSEGESR